MGWVGRSAPSAYWEEPTVWYRLMPWKNLGFRPQPMRRNLGGPPERRFPFSRALARINSMEQLSTICETMFSMPTIGSMATRTTHPFPKQKNAKMTSEERLRDQSSETKPFSFSLTKASDCVCRQHN